MERVLPLLWLLSTGCIALGDKGGAGVGEQAQEKQDIPKSCVSYAQLMGSCFQSDAVRAQALAGFATDGMTEDQVEKLGASCSESQQAMARSCR